MIDIQKLISASIYTAIHFPYRTLTLLGKREAFKYSDGDEIAKFQDRLAKIARTQADNHQGFQFKVDGETFFVKFSDWKMYVAKEGMLS